MGKLRSGKVQVEIVRPDGSKDLRIWRGSDFNRAFTEKRLTIIKIIREHGEITLENLKDELFKKGYEGYSKDVLVSVRVLSELTLIKVNSDETLSCNFKNLIVRI